MSIARSNSTLNLNSTETDRMNLKSTIKTIDSSLKLQVEKFRPITAKSSFKRSDLNKFESSMKIEKLSKGKLKQ
jgi:hypothetical protein